MFAIFADVIQRPAFAQNRIDLLKRQYSGGIARRNDDPDEITSREFRKLVYGANSPYARTMEYATLDAITRDDIQGFTRRLFAQIARFWASSETLTGAQMKLLIKRLLQRLGSSRSSLDIAETAPGGSGQNRHI